MRAELVKLELHLRRNGPEYVDTLATAFFFR
jgi:hypothetical protein